jgi:hypothetical protein
VSHFFFLPFFGLKKLDNFDCRNFKSYNGTITQSQLKEKINCCVLCAGPSTLQRFRSELVIGCSKVREMKNGMVCTVSEIVQSNMKDKCYVLSKITDKLFSIGLQIQFIR